MVDIHRVHSIHNHSGGHGDGERDT
jgi:hypothetical protein